MNGKATVTAGPESEDVLLPPGGEAAPKASPSSKPPAAKPPHTPAKTRPSAKAQVVPMDRSKRRLLKPAKDLRHLDSRSGVKAALKVEKADTRFDSPPRFKKHPTACYAHRAQPCPGTSNDALDRVLADVLYGRPMSAMESRRIDENRLTLRKHVGPRGGRELFVASFQQRLSQDESPTDVQVARRVLLSSTSRTDPACSSRQLPWFQQVVLKVDGQRLAEAEGKTPRTPNGAPTPRPVQPAEGGGGERSRVGKAATDSPAAAAASATGRATATPAAGLAMYPGQRAWAVGSGRPPPSTSLPVPSSGSGRPPPSTSSGLSAENLKAHERSLGGTPRSSAAGSQRSGRSGSQASSHSSRSSRSGNRRRVAAEQGLEQAEGNHRVAGGSGATNSAYSESGDSELSTASAPLRQVDWNQVVAQAERQGVPHRQRAHSADVPASSQVNNGPLGNPAAMVRRLRNPGTANARNTDAKDLISPRESPVPYRRCRRAHGGAPPPRKIMGVFDRDTELLSPMSSPYRRVRGSRAMPPCEQLTMPLGDQRLGQRGCDERPGRIFPAPWGLASVQV